MLSPSRWNTDNATIIINAPVDLVWETLIDIDDWEWNKRIRLCATAVERGIAGKVKTFVNGQWKTFDFVFGEVSAKNYKFTWTLGWEVFGPIHAMVAHEIVLEKLDSNITQLSHSASIKGMLPRLGLPKCLPYKKLRRNDFLMNEELKVHVENINNFNSRLYSQSSICTVSTAESDSKPNKKGAEARSGTEKSFWEGRRR
jgi:hypothetical protein